MVGLSDIRDFSLPFLAKWHGHSRNCLSEASFAGVAE